MRLGLCGLAVVLAWAGMSAARAEEPLPGAPAPVVPSFVEETASAGIDNVYKGEWEYMVGGGAASFDCNSDGYPDLLLAGGEQPARFYRNASKRGGVLAFTVEPSGLELYKVSGAYPLDVDGDGITDIVLLRVGENVVMRGLGGCKFERANEAWSFAGGDSWWTSLSATWEKGAGWPTIAVGSYIDRHEEISPWGSCTDNWLLRPAAGARGFDSPIALKPSFCPLSILFTDWNRSGTPSLRVSNDREYYEGGQEQMWKVEPGKPPALYTADEGWKYLRIWGMGIASYDLDFDGYPEYFLTSMADNKLQTLAVVPKDGSSPKPAYADVAYPSNVTAHRPYFGDDLKPSTAWHTQFEDVNNDGLVDLFIAKGNVWDMPDFAMKDPNNLLLQAVGGKFVEVGDKAGVASVEQGRGAALADFNLDGLVDLVVVNRNSPAQIWRNTTAGAGGWIGVKLEQDAPNRDGVGAWIELRCEGMPVMRREVTVGGGHAGGQAGWWHFGLGVITSAEVRVLWPDGTAGEWQPVEAGRFYVLRRGEAPVPFDPA
ncbi:CRTAC1 family protein [Mesorhizobium marinum]|uniref:CRTAC1 family protein n=1 Tax=Mesorhizobium marinum TaxID=3228790 RepID=UPI003466C9AE